MRGAKMKMNKGKLKTIISIAAGITIITLTTTGCNSKMLSSTQKQAPGNAQATLSTMTPTTEKSSIPTSKGSELAKTSSKSTTNKSETSTELTNELKTYLKTNYGIGSHEKSWYKYISRIAVNGKSVTINTSLHTDKKVATAIANAVLGWPKFSGIVTIEGSNGSTLAKESKA